MAWDLQWYWPMRTDDHILDALRELNRVQIKPPGSFIKLSKREQARQIEALRSQLPTSILGHHDRRIASGQKSLVGVRKGFCGGCHLKLPRGHKPMSPAHANLDVCDNCGIFLDWSGAQ